MENVCVKEREGEKWGELKLWECQGREVFVHVGIKRASATEGGREFKHVDTEYDYLINLFIQRRSWEKEHSRLMSEGVEIPTPSCGVHPTSSFATVKTFRIEMSYYRSFLLFYPQQKLPSLFFLFFFLWKMDFYLFI